ncbi:MAG TPA: isoprenylcysteine carboxylmethyltransferase family protein [Cellvibrionaceae bacterium]
MLPRAPALPPLPFALLLAVVAVGFRKFNQLPYSIHFLFPLILGLCGCALMVLAFVQFRLRKTSLHPMNFANNNFLLISGVFRMTPNPIYLGMLLVLVGFAIYLEDLLAVMSLLVFFLWINYWQIPVEEVHLRSHFGAAYNNYCNKVRRWL